MRATLSSEQHFWWSSCAAASCATHASHAQGGGGTLEEGWCKRTGPAGEAFERESCGMALESECRRLRAHRCPAQLSSVQDAWMSYCQSFPLLPRGAPTPATTLVGQNYVVRNACHAVTLFVRTIAFFLVACRPDLCPAALPTLCVTFPPCFAVCLPVCVCFPLSPETGGARRL